MEDISHAQIFFRLLIEGRYPSANPIGLSPKYRLNNSQLYCPFEPLTSVQQDNDQHKMNTRVEYHQLEWRLDQRPPKKKPMETKQKNDRPSVTNKQGKTDADVSGLVGGEGVSYFAVDTIALSRGDLLSNPEVDPLVGVMFDYWGPGPFCSPSIGVIAVQPNTVHDPDEDMTLDRDDHYGLGSLPTIDDVLIVPNEKELIKALVYTIVALDPDVICCWDTEKGALDYLSRRSQYHGILLEDSIKRLGRDIFHRLGNIPIYAKNHFHLGLKSKLYPMLFERFYFTEYAGNEDKSYTIKRGFSESIPGRFVINLWRACRHEYLLTSYTLQNVVKHLTGKTFPILHHKEVTRSLTKGDCRERSRVFAYLISNIKCLRVVMQNMSLIERTIEMAKVYTTDFASVLTRGSQFFIEAHLTRAAYAAGYVLFSATPQLLAAQPSLECIALNMEPPKVFVAE